MAIAYNADSRTEVRNSLISYLSSSMHEPALVFMDLKEICETFDFEVEVSKTKWKELDW